MVFVGHFHAGELNSEVYRIFPYAALPPRAAQIPTYSVSTASILKPAWAY